MSAGATVLIADTDNQNVPMATGVRRRRLATDRDPARFREVKDAVRLEVERYADRNPLSAARHERAAKSMPGGNTRSILHFEPFPLAFERGEDAHLWSLDGHRYVDFLGEFTAGLYGHSDQVILGALRTPSTAGSASAAQRPRAAAGRAICARFPTIDLVRFTNSGTEANLMAIALAAAVTGRREDPGLPRRLPRRRAHFRRGPSPVNVPHDWVLATTTTSRAPGR